MDEESEEFGEDLGNTISEEKVFERLAGGINKRLSANNDYWMAITGPEGSGKTTLALKLARAVDEKFSVERNCIVNPTIENVLEKIVESDVKAIVVDEAINIAYNREHLRSENVFFVKLSAVCRKKNKFIILCIPQMRSLDIAIRNHRLRCWIFVPERGNAIVLVPNFRNPFCTDPWYLQMNEKQIEKAEGKRRIVDISTAQEISMLKQTKTFWFSFRFSKLDEATEKKYNYLVETQGKKIFYEQMETLKETRVIREMDEFFD